MATCEEIPGCLGSSGGKVWKLNGEIHRDGDLPAEIYGGMQTWYRHGKIHRDGGLPAVVRYGTVDEGCYRYRIISRYMPVNCVRETGQEWYVNGVRHRDGDLPSIERINGDNVWYQNDRLHRDGNLPAVVLADGSRYWYQFGEIHRDGDMPAIEFADGAKRWFRHGKMHRDGDLPADEYEGYKAWYRHGLSHRDGMLPAVEYKIGFTLNYTDGRRLEYPDGRLEWWKYGKQYTIENLTNLYSGLSKFGRQCLVRIRMRRLWRNKWIHGELLCMPPKGNFLGGADYHKMVGYFIN